MRSSMVVLIVLMASLGLTSTAFADDAHGVVLAERQLVTLSSLTSMPVDSALSTRSNSPGCAGDGDINVWLFFDTKLSLLDDTVQIHRNNTLFLFGGSVLRVDDGNSKDPDLLELDLTKSFAIAKGQIPWKKSTVQSTTFPPGLQEQPSSIWEYDLTGKKWTQTSTWKHEDKIFPYRYSRGTSVTLPNEEVGYYIGGLKAYQNSTFQGWYYTYEEQSVSVNLTNGEVIKRSPLPLKKKRIDATVVYLPVRPKGVLVLIGEQKNIKSGYSRMETIWIYNLDGQSWHFQTAIGDSPWERKNICMVAVSYANKSMHNIYIYVGGTDSKVTMLGINNTGYGDM
ncbi:hypothetical protein RUND412_009288 [Rhizina undulata]